MRRLGEEVIPWILCVVLHIMRAKASQFAALVECCDQLQPTREGPGDVVSLAPLSRDASKYRSSRIA